MKKSQPEKNTMPSTLLNEETWATDASTMPKILASAKPTLNINIKA